ncbi:MAG: hypothetical protein LUH36_01340 [Oscillospiraceae bacterium]|nr:hypothetical protein [Oscillospiraceae bacterium]
MKQFIAMLLIALALLGTAACSVDGVTIDMEAAAEAVEALGAAGTDETAGTAETTGDTGTADIPADTDSGEENRAPDAVSEGEQSEASASDAEDASPATATDAETNSGDTQTGTAPEESGGQSGFDYEALTVDDCVEDAWPEEGVLPHITLDCEGAEAINTAIDEEFTAYADDPMCVVYYQCFKNEQVLSILMVLDYQADYKLYTPYNLNLSTGQEMTPEELAAVFDVTLEELAALELDVLGQEFEYQYGGMKSSDEEFYQQQYDRTTASDNADTDRLWIGGDGQLYFVGRIYAMAGAESYEYMMGSGLALELDELELG